jgi:hypothetical protein
MPALRRADDLDEGVVALPGVPLQGGVLRLNPPSMEPETG